MGLMALVAEAMPPPYAWTTILIQTPTFQIGLEVGVGLRVSFFFFFFFRFSGLSFGIANATGFGGFQVHALC